MLWARFSERVVTDPIVVGAASDTSLKSFNHEGIWARHKDILQRDRARGRKFCIDFFGGQISVVYAKYAKCTVGV